MTVDDHPSVPTLVGARAASRGGGGDADRGSPGSAEAAPGLAGLGRGAEARAHAEVPADDEGAAGRRAVGLFLALAADELRAVAVADVNGTGRVGNDDRDDRDG